MLLSAFFRHTISVAVVIYSGTECEISTCGHLTCCLLPPTCHPSGALCPSISDNAPDFASCNVQSPACSNGSHTAHVQSASVTDHCFIHWVSHAWLSFLHLLVLLYLVNTYSLLIVTFVFVLHAKLLRFLQFVCFSVCRHLSYTLKLSVLKSSKPKKKEKKRKSFVEIYFFCLSLPAAPCKDKTFGFLSIYVQNAFRKT